MQENKTAIVYLAIIAAIVIVLGMFVLGNLKDNGDEGVVLSDLAAANPSGEDQFTTLDGQPVSLADFEGKVVVANAWATWCPFCVNELPDFGELAREFADQNVVVVAINRKEAPGQQHSFLGTIGSTEGIEFWADQSDFYYRTIGGFTMPETVFYDRNGNISFHKRGFMPLSEMRQHTENALSITNETP